MRQTDCNGILPCSDPGQHKLVWSGDHCGQESAQHPESAHPFGPDPLPGSAGTGEGGHYSHRRGVRGP